MTAILKVDTIQDTAGNNIINESSDTITIGASGDTVAIPSGATITGSGLGKVLQVVSGTTLTFSAAPSSGTASIFVNYLNLASGSLVPADENKGTFQAGSIFRTNVQSLTVDTSISATTNASCAGPLEVASGVTLTVASGGRLTVL